MSEFKLHCFGESGNSYKPALMLEICRLDWQPVWIDFFNGATRDPAFRHDVNEMGEAPVLEHGTLRLTQSGVILDYLAEQTITSSRRVSRPCASSSTSPRRARLR